MLANNTNGLAPLNNSAWAFSNISAVLTNLLCDNCGIKPKYFDGTTFYPHCGKTCAQVYDDPSGAKGPSKFCSLNHRKLAKEACLWCKKEPKKQGQFCSRACTQNAQLTSPSLLEVPEGHVVFEDVEKQFKNSWRDATVTCPAVRKVYKVIISQASLDKYDAYRKSVEARGKFLARGIPAGNENRRWHGTRRECNLGDPGNTQFCASPSCPLCCIIKTSFDVSKSGKGQFGVGIYTSSTSRKSDHFSKNVNFTSPLKAILLNKVVVGKGCKMLKDDNTLVAPPAGYDSVLGEVGGGLWYDEVIVYSNDAARPSFLVMYE
ncbi:hypothetical protein M0805_001800 [Coniferiporia weirii]|nr:hypothetical protein M0805_001800 [Coniferiporia weirii]